MKYLCTLLLIVSALQLHAQRNFKPGYIVSLSGDTTKGFVDYKDWNQNPKQIAFKTSETANADQYTTRTISAFGVTGSEGYTRYIGPISQASVETARLINNREVTVKQDSVFLRLITTGKTLSLFEYADDIKLRYFIAEGTAAPFELNFYRYFNIQNDRIITDNVFQQQLQRFVANHQPGNQKLINQVQSAGYDLTDIEKVVLAINGSQGKQIESRSATVFFAGLAANATYTNFNNATESSLVSVLPQLNAGVNFVLNKNVGTVIFRGELNITSAKADIKLIQSQFIDGLERTTFDEFTVSLAPQVIYNFYNSGKLKIFLGGGLGISWNKISNQKDYFYSGRIDESSSSSTGFSTILKTGMSLPKFEFYTGFNKPIEDYVPNSIRSRSYQLGVNYFF